MKRSSFSEEQVSFSSECLACVVDTSLSGHRMRRALDYIARVRG